MQIYAIQKVSKILTATWRRNKCWCMNVYGNYISLCCCRSFNWNDLFYCFDKLLHSNHYTHIFWGLDLTISDISHKFFSLPCAWKATKKTISCTGRYVKIMESLGNAMHQDLPQVTHPDLWLQEHTSDHFLPLLITSVTVHCHILMIKI